MSGERPVIFMDEKGNVTTTDGQAVLAMFKAIDYPRVGQKLLPLIPHATIAEAAAHIESLEARIEAMSESLRVIVSGSGYEWSETREQLHRIIDANVECAQNALAVLTGAQHERS